MSPVLFPLVVSFFAVFFVFCFQPSHHKPLMSTIPTLLNYRKTRITRQLYKTPIKRNNFTWFLAIKAHTPDRVLPQVLTLNKEFTVIEISSKFYVFYKVERSTQLKPIHAIVRLKMSCEENRDSPHVFVSCPV